MLASVVPDLPNAPWPHTWVNVTDTLTRQDKIGLAQAAIAQFVAGYGPVPATSATNTDPTYPPYLLSAIARKDIIAGTRDNEGYVTAGLYNYSRAIPRINNGTGATSADIVWNGLYGVALVDAYRAYGNATLLGQATAIWHDISPWQRANTTELYLDCPVSLVGGVQETSGPSSSGIVTYSSKATMSFLLLSSYLAELHVNATAQDVSAFTTAAVQAATFMSQLTDYAYNDILYESLAGSSAPDASPCASTFGLDDSVTSAAMFAEGVYVLADVLGNSTWNDTASVVVEHIVGSFSTRWVQADGLLNLTSATESSGGPSEKLYLMNYLYEPWLRALDTKPLDSSVALIIQAFANRQLHALLANATTGNSSLYAEDWAGSPAANFTLAGMSAALPALALAIGPPTALPLNASAYNTTLSFITPFDSPGLPFWTQDHKATVASACIGLLIFGLLAGALARWRAQNRAAARIARRDILAERDREKGDPDVADDGAPLGTLPVYMGEGEDAEPVGRTEEDAGAAGTIEITTPDGKRVLCWGTQRPLSLPLDMNMPSIPTNPTSPARNGQVPTTLSLSIDSAPGAHTELGAEPTPENNASTSSAGIPPAPAAPTDEPSSTMLTWDGQLPSAERRASKINLSSDPQHVNSKGQAAAPEPAPTEYVPVIAPVPTVPDPSGPPPPPLVSASDPLAALSVADLRQRLQDVGTPEILQLLQERIRLEGGRGEEGLPRYEGPRQGQ